MEHAHVAPAVGVLVEVVLRQRPRGGVVAAGAAHDEQLPAVLADQKVVKHALLVRPQLLEPRVV